jgi:N-acetyl-gamma-glutamyl-phosphate reductase
VTTVHIWGASGYAAAEAMRWIAGHPALELGVLESRSHAGQRVGDHFPLLRTVERTFAPSGSVLAEVAPGDLVIAAGGHGEAIATVPALLTAGARVVDLSADYRFSDDAVYGLTEWNRTAIAGASLVANPGCYPTATLLAALPLRAFAPPLQWIVDAKSGITGAGRNPSVGALYAEVSGDIRAYGLTGHRHQPEMQRQLAFEGLDAPLTFTPHVVPLARGMLSDVYAVYAQPLDASAVHAAFGRAYAGNPFVRILEPGQAPSVAAVVGTNDAELLVDVQGAVVRVLCAIDNLGKGAAGQAVANINVMLGLAEETGFHARAVVA